MIKNTENSYGLITKIFHWLISISIIILIIVGFSMSSMEPSPDKWELYGMHKASGVIVLMLILARIAWKFTNKSVKPAENTPKLLVIAAHAGHFFLYVFMLAMPISGILMSYFSGHNIVVFDLFTIHAAIEKSPEIAKIFHTTHGIGAWGFVFLISTHIIAAFYHHFIRRDNTLTRMIK